MSCTQSHVATQLLARIFSDVRENRFDVHIVLARAGKYAIERLPSLQHLPEKGACITALPMKIDGTGGAPTRVIAKVPQPIPVADPDSGAAVQMSLWVTAIMSACAIAFSRAASVDIYA